MVSDGLAERFEDGNDRKYGVSMDTLGIVGNVLIDQLDKIGLAQVVTGALVSALGAISYRVIQVILQKIPTKWRWVGNNVIVKGILNKIIGKLFGKTTLLYNMQLEEEDKRFKEAHDRARKEAIKHLSRKGGILKEFEKAMEKLK